MEEIRNICDKFLGRPVILYARAIWTRQPQHILRYISAQLSPGINKLWKITHSVGTDRFAENGIARGADIVDWSTE